MTATSACISACGAQTAWQCALEIFWKTSRGGLQHNQISGWESAEDLNSAIQKQKTEDQDPPKGLNWTFGTTSYYTRDSHIEVEDIKVEYFSMGGPIMLVSLVKTHQPCRLQCYDLLPSRLAHGPAAFGEDGPAAGTRSCTVVSFVFFLESSGIGDSRPKFEPRNQMPTQPQIGSLFAKQSLKRG